MREEMDFGSNYFKPEDFKYTFTCSSTGEVIFRCNKQSFIEVLRDILHIKLEDFRRFYLKLYNVEIKMKGDQPLFIRGIKESQDITDLISYNEIVEAFRSYQTKYEIEVN
ncbi:hypothetical protein [Haloplasma contractile]|uniref:Uncharacterized protein n=1 Tax=Haloplasma contractile SSD-17B TaxID=1033810 RepID=U2DXC4_9MOLU|nr:hypothetical protein [Haloplasma contractile]ERJ12942.1 hypothetical protein HLPCO_001282 [Haloplasma contractile SSD-17B]